MRYYVGVDLGQSSDYTAIAILGEMPPDNPGSEKMYAIRHLERFRDVLYPDVANRIVALVDSPILKYRSELIIDATGVGPAVTDLLKKRNRQFKAVKIHGGDAESRADDGSYRVPKRNLISTLQVLLQTGRLKIASSLELAQTLRAELLNFRVKINLKTAHDSYEAWREGDHDDLVLAAALAAWGAGKVPPMVAPPLIERQSYWTDPCSYQESIV